MRPTASELDIAASDSSGLDAACCPLCGQANGCAMEASKASGLPAANCWCMDARFAPALLARVPESLRNRACVCSTCAHVGS